MSTHLYYLWLFCSTSELWKNRVKYAFYPTNSAGNECSGDYLFEMSFIVALSDILFAQLIIMLSLKCSAHG